MAINRGPFNALVDDDGSNSVGTPWNKAAIAGVLLDPIDQLVTSWASIPFNAADFTATPSGAWTVAAGGTFVRSRWGTTELIVLFLNAGSNIVTGTPTFLRVQLPVTTALIVGAPFTYYGPVFGTGYAELAGSSIGLLRDVGGTPWVAGSYYIALQLHVLT